MKLKVTILRKTFWDVETLPACQVARAVCMLFGCTTFSAYDLKALQSRGFRIVVVSENVRKKPLSQKLMT